jgi:hypothetical protein
MSTFSSRMRSAKGSTSFILPYLLSVFGICGSLAFDHDVCSAAERALSRVDEAGRKDRGIGLSCVPLNWRLQ